MNREYPYISRIAERIGEKMKHLRNSRGMTQRELSEGIVSRNMLSMIESGNAIPSIETLLQMSEVLSVPPGYFFAEGDEEIMYAKKEVIGTAYSLMNAKMYSEVIRICEAYAEDDAEMCLLASVAYLRNAEELLGRYMLASAHEMILRAEKFAGLLPAFGESLSELCHFIMALIENVGSEDIPESLFSDIDFTGSGVPVSYLLYLKAYKILKDGDTECASALARSGLIEGFKALHIRGAVLMAEGDYDGATRFFDLALSSDDGGFFSKYKLLCDLEYCRKSAGDFEAAYELSTSRMEMLGIFTK